MLNLLLIIPYLMVGFLIYLVTAYALIKDGENYNGAGSALTMIAWPLAVIFLVIYGATVGANWVLESSWKTIQKKVRAS